MSLKALLIGVFLSALSGPTLAQSLAPQLHARPSINAVSALAPGETQLANRAIAYRPARLPAGPAALVVILHGAGGYPLDFLQRMEPIADRRGFILLYPHSLGGTWDLVQNLSADRDPWRGLDAHRLDQSLAELFARAPIDPERIVLLGFSDGASYALSLGTSNPRLFKGVLALSPGMMITSNGIDRRQRIFIAHGRSDHVLPFEHTRDSIVHDLKEAGANLGFHPFDGDHEIDPKSLDEGLSFTLGLQASTLVPTSTFK